MRGRGWDRIDRPLPCALAENEDVLAWEHFDRLNPIKRQHGHFLFDLRLRHLVERFDGHIGVLAPIFHKDHATARLQRAANPLIISYGKSNS